MTVGESIQKFRKELGLSQEELGQKSILQHSEIHIVLTLQNVRDIIYLKLLYRRDNICVIHAVAIHKKQNCAL